MHSIVVPGIVFKPDGKGLLSASWDRLVINWDVSLLKSTHEDKPDYQKEGSPTQDLTDGLKEISRLVGHEVRRLLGLSFPPLLKTHTSVFFRAMFALFLYHPMAIGLRLVHWIRLFESGMAILLHCSVSYMVMDQLCPLISVPLGIIW